MSASYDPTHPEARDRVRANLGDTEVEPAEDAHHSNEHMDALLAELGEALGQAALAHELWARYAQDPQRVALTGLSIDLSAQLDVWSALAGPWLAHLQQQATQAAAAARAPANPVRPAAFGLARGRRGR
jgi:hypothetical protein